MSWRRLGGLAVSVLLLVAVCAPLSWAQDQARITALSSKSKLTKPEQEELALALFKLMAADTSDKPEFLVTHYTTVIEKCPDTERAHIAYWRLTNVYNQLYDPPKHEEIVRLLEQFLDRYKTSDVVSMKKFSDRQLVFSPILRLHQAYEALGQFDKIVAYYDKEVSKKVKLGIYDTFEYASALDKVERGKDAMKYYQSFLDATKGNDDVDFMRDMATARIDELKPKKK